MTESTRKVATLQQRLNLLFQKLPLFHSHSFFGLLNPFGALFNTYPLTRYSTKFELCINAIGILAAAAAGTAQVCTDFLGPREVLNVLF